MAVWCVKPGATVGVDELVAHCRRSLAGYKIPRRIEFSPGELPKERFWEDSQEGFARALLG